MRRIFRERNANRVAEAVAQQRADADGRLDAAVLAFAGFGDAKNDPARAALLSKLRAMAVRRELARQGVEVKEVTGMGDELPVAGNDLEQGRLRNRRVEVWVY